MERIYGTEQSDWVDGNGADNWFDGEGGAEQFFGRNGDDTFLGRDGADFAKMGKGRDLAYGGEGDDILGGGNGADSLYGNQGRDQIIGGRGNDIVDGGEDDDIITVYDGKATSHDGNDHYEGGTNDADDWGEVIWGDLLIFMGLEGGVEIDAQAGKAWGREAGSAKMGTDTFSGFETYDGTDFDDVYHAESGGHAMFYAFGGDDLIMAALGEHRFLGGQGNDTVDYSGVDAALKMDLSLNHSEAQLYDVSTGEALGFQGVSNIENVTGSAHDDQIFGDAYDNVLEGGAGNDVLVGNAGNDSFVFDNLQTPDADRVVDFTKGEDTLVLRSMTTPLGLAINGFADLDTNGDGKFNANDDGFTSYGGNGYMLFDGAVVELDGITSLKAVDLDVA